MNSRDDAEAELYPYSRPGRSELGRFRALAQDERDASSAWQADGEPNLSRAHLREALRLEVLGLHSEGQLSALLCGAAVVLAERSTSDDVDELLAAAQALLVP